MLVAVYAVEAWTGPLTSWLKALQADSRRRFPSGTHAMTASTASVVTPCAPGNSTQDSFFSLPAGYAMSRNTRTEKRHLVPRSKKRSPTQQPSADTWHSLKDGQFIRTALSSSSRLSSLQADEKIPCAAHYGVGNQDTVCGAVCHEGCVG